VIVVGAPGDGPLWSELARQCAARGVTFTVVAGSARSTTARLALTWLAGDNGASGGLVIQRGSISVLVALGADPVAARGQALIGKVALAPDSGVSVQLTSDAPAGAVEHVVVGGTAPTRIVLEPSRLRVHGGTLLAPAVNATPEGDTP
jgi:hypothetical protein